MKNSKVSLTFLTTILIIFTLGCSFFSQLFPGKVVPISVGPIELPQPPAPTVAIKGTPEEQAIYFAEQLAVPETRLAGWLGLYDALGVPVFGPDAKPLGSTRDDPIGPDFWYVWLISGLDERGRGIRISDAGRLFSGGMSEINGSDLGVVLQHDLQLAAASSDPQIRLFGMFVRERIKQGPSHIDITTAGLDPAKVIIDPATLQMIAWITFRSALFRSARTTAPATIMKTDSTGVAFLRAQTVTASRPCAEIIGGNKTITDWTGWILRKVIAKGIQLPGMEKAIPGTTERLLKHFFNATSEEIAPLKTGLSWFNAVESALTLLMRVMAMEIDAAQDPEPLIRTKGTTDGKPGNVTFALSLNPGTGDDGNSLDNCVMSFLAYSAGINYSKPPKGRLAGAELEFKGGAGFPELVLFADYKDLFGRDTNSGGEVTIALIGAAQKKQLPENSRPVDKEFSIHVSGQPEAYTGKTIFNTFFNGLTFGVSPNAPSAITSILDILKTVHFDLGEHYFRLTDWQPRGYRASGSDGPVVYSGVICSLEQPFTVTGKHPLFPLPLNFTPSSPTTGTMSYGTGGSGISASGGGTYKIDGATTDTPVIVINTKSTATIPGTTTSGGGKATIFLLPLETGECN